MAEGTLYEMQQDSTYNKFEVKYDHKNDAKNGIAPSNQVPIKKNLISSGHKNIVK
jgi:hypothetical protein